MRPRTPLRATCGCLIVRLFVRVVGLEGPQADEQNRQYPGDSADAVPGPKRGRQPWEGTRGALLKAPRLRSGDRVRFVSPASTPDRERVECGAGILESWGLRVEI